MQFKNDNFVFAVNSILIYDFRILLIYYSMHAAPRATSWPWQALRSGGFGTFAGTKRLGKLWRSWLTAERGLWRRGTHREAAQGWDGTSGIRGLSLLAATPSRRDRPGLSVPPATLTSGVPETPTEILRPALEWRTGRKVAKSFCFVFLQKKKDFLAFVSSRAR